LCSQFYRKTYVAAVIPSCEEDVVETVKFAVEKNLPFAPRSGHHCVTTSMRHLRGGILIDMRPLNSMRLNDDQTVTVGGGVITDDFVRFLQENGLEVSRFSRKASLKVIGLDLAS
jgi:FAD/FMN-containing dehydrogenase